MSKSLSPLLPDQTRRERQKVRRSKSSLEADQPSLVYLAEAGPAAHNIIRTKGYNIPSDPGGSCRQQILPTRRSASWPRCYSNSKYHPSKIPHAITLGGRRTPG